MGGSDRWGGGLGSGAGGVVEVGEGICKGKWYTRVAREKRRGYGRGLGWWEKGCWPDDERR